MESLHHAIGGRPRREPTFLASSLFLKQTVQCCVSAVILKYFTLSQSVLLFLQQNYFASWVPGPIGTAQMIPFTSQLGYEPMKEKLQCMHDPVPPSVLISSLSCGLLWRWTIRQRPSFCRNLDRCRQKGWPVADAALAVIRCHPVSEKLFHDLSA